MSCLCMTFLSEKGLICECVVNFIVHLIVHPSKMFGSKTISQLVTNSAVNSFVYSKRFWKLPQS